MTMKNVKRAICAVLLLCIAGVISACASGATGVVLRKEGSWFSNYEVAGDEVHFNCILRLQNTTNQAQAISIYGKFDEDAKNGLVKENRLLAHDADEPTVTAFYLAAGAEISVEVTFTGTFAGTAEKHDRLLPELEIVKAE